MPSPFHRFIDRFRKKSPSMSSSSHPALLRTEAKQDLDIWTKDMEKAWGDDREHRPAFDMYKLRSLQLWKHDDGVKHEVLLGEFDSGTATVYIAVDRTSIPQNQKDLALRGSAGRSIASITPTGSQASVNAITEGSAAASRVIAGSEESGSSTPAVHAVDTIYVVPKCTSIKDAIKRVAYLRGSPKDVYSCAGSKDPTPTQLAPNLVNFVYAAYSASYVETRYTITDTNCYWFASATVYVLDAKFWSVPVAEKFKRESVAGRWSLFNIKLGVVKPDQMGQLIEKFERCVSPIIISGPHFPDYLMFTSITDAW